jgi:uncharacterized protein (TIGR00251 family)
VRSPADDSPPSWIAAAPGGVVLHVRVQPGASRTRVAGLHGEAVKVQLRARPIEGAANRELVAVLAEALAVRPAAIAVVSGLHGRAKRVRVDGVDVATVLGRLGPFVDKTGVAD